MKRKLFLILFLLLGIGLISPTLVSAKPVEEEYEVNAPGWTDEQFLDYYIENRIFLSTPPSGTGKRLFASGVANHL